MRLYEGIKDGKATYYAGAQEATKAVGGKRAPDTEVAAIDTATVTTKQLLLAVLNYGEWAAKRTVLHTKGEPMGGVRRKAAAEAAPVAAVLSAGEPSYTPAQIPQGAQGAIWGILNTLRRVPPGERLAPWELAQMELKLDRCAGACGVRPLTPERKAELKAITDAFHSALDAD